jgi:geranylgeranyl pyrophosphate synthase
MTTRPTPLKTTAAGQVHTDVDRFLKTFFAQKIKQSRAIDDNYTVLWQALRDVTLAGGKRFRPYLLLLFYEGYGGQDYESVLPVAAAQELLHTSLLIHDDIIDKDYVRHGEPNVAGIFKDYYQQFPLSGDTAHYANSAALLGGNLLLASAYDLTTAANLNATTKLSVLQELSRSIFTVYGGEMLDMESVMQPFEAVDSLRIAELKTAYYSCIAPALTGAALAGAGKSEHAQLKAFGTALGIAYQLVDDLLGVFGDEAVTGKSSLSDIREGKRTFLMAQALALAGRPEQKILAASLGKTTLTAAEADQVRTIVTNSGARQATITQITAYAAQARASLEKLPITGDAKQALEQLIQQALVRVT